MEALTFIFLGVLLGSGMGASLTLAIAHWRGMFKPVVKVTISVRPGPEALSMSSVQPNEYIVVVRDAAEGSGNVVIPKEFAPHRH
jgi:hypothetical protein